MSMPPTCWAVLRAGDSMSKKIVRPPLECELFEGMMKSLPSGNIIS